MVHITERQEMNLFLNSISSCGLDLAAQAMEMGINVEMRKRKNKKEEMKKMKNKRVEMKKMKNKKLEMRKMKNKKAEMMMKQQKKPQSLEMQRESKAPWIQQQDGWV